MNRGGVFQPRKANFEVRSIATNRLFSPGICWIGLI